ncbi:MAG: hypothetical protein WCS25_09435, partial [Victivallaceae bacterium]
LTPCRSFVIFRETHKKHTFSSIGKNLSLLYLFDRLTDIILKMCVDFLIDQNPAIFIDKTVNIQKKVKKTNPHYFSA